MHRSSADAVDFGRKLLIKAFLLPIFSVAISWCFSFRSCVFSSTSTTTDTCCSCSRRTCRIDLRCFLRSSNVVTIRYDTRSLPQHIVQPSPMTLNVLESDWRYSEPLYIELLGHVASIRCRRSGSLHTRVTLGLYVSMFLFMRHKKCLSVIIYSVIIIRPTVLLLLPTTVLFSAPTPYPNAGSC